MKKKDRIRLLVLILLLQAALALSVLSALLLKPPPPAFPLPKAIPRISPMPEPPAPVVPVIKKAPEEAVVLGHFSFETQESLKNWEEKTFKGGTVYKVLNENGAGFLECTSERSSSGLYIKVDQAVSPKLFLSWRWQAKKFPQKKKPDELSNKQEDDFAARVYLIFPGANFFKSDVIEYIWDEKIPVDTFAPSPYSSRIKLLVIESGEGGRWREEERSVYEDYRRLFGKDPGRALGVIALMSDSDNTETGSEADFADFVLKLKK